MISRTGNASGSIARTRSRVVTTAAAPALALFAVFALFALGGCKKKKPKPFPPAPQLSTATTEGAALGPDAGLVPVPVPVATAVVPVVATAAPVPADTLSPADRAALEQAKTTIGELEMMVKKGVVTNPDKPEDGDASTKCAALEGSHAQLEALADPDAKKAAADTKRLCSLEVPILNADKALKQVTISPSQASRKLMCGFAQKDIDKARKVSATDRRVRDLDARFGRACR